jgi:hypothetical protein
VWETYRYGAERVQAGYQGMTYPSRYKSSAEPEMRFKRLGDPVADSDEMRFAGVGSGAERNQAAPEPELCPIVMTTSVSLSGLMMIFMFCHSNNVSLGFLVAAGRGILRAA